MPSLDFTVALRIVRRGFDVGQPGQADKFLKVLGDKLRPVVGYDPRPGLGISLASPLQDDFRVGFLHGGADIPADYVT